MDIQKVFAVVGILQVMYEVWNQFGKVDAKCNELNKTLKELQSKAKDMDDQAMAEEKPGKKRKRVVQAYFKQVKCFRSSANKGLGKLGKESWKVKRMTWGPFIERHQREGKELLKRGEELRQKGLTDNEITRRGEKLPLGDPQYTSTTTNDLKKSALWAMKKNSAQCIGIYGPVGAGKTNLMKCLFNKIHDDDRFEVVYWATAPEVDPDPRNYNKALQKCVADGMWIDDFDKYHSEETRAGRINAKLGEIGKGRAVFFLDNVREDFSAYELLGLPSLGRNTETESESESDQGCNLTNCILVFTTRSKDICNKMQCDLTLKLDHLNAIETEEMFLNEVRINSKQRQKIRKIAVEVAHQCAGVPLVIISIARIMAGSEDLQEWRNCLNELKGIVNTIHEDEEAKILKKLQFGYNCLKDHTAQLCFLKAARLLKNDHQIPKKKIIRTWKESGLIGMDRQGQLIDDQGHTILNQLERMCLLQVVPDCQTVTMNKWICKMAEKIEKIDN